MALAAGVMALVVGAMTVGAQAEGAAVDAAFARFFGAADRPAAERLAGDVIATGVSFDEAYGRLRRGRRYDPEPLRGVQRLTRRTTDGLEHPYTLVIPDDYDATRAYQVRVQLHGGIARPSPQPDRDGRDRIAGDADQIAVYPGGWADAMWWYGNQVENLTGLLGDLKRRYNVDENRVYLTGISDGATGAYFMALRDTTPWASFLPLNGHMMVLANPSTGADGQLYPGNAVNKPWFIVNGGQDRLYPTRSVEPYVEHLRTIGATVVYHPQPDAGHDTSWWPRERESFEAFVRAHPRDALPDRLSWETERTDRYNRAHWLIIDEMGSTGSDASLRDTNLLDRGLMRLDIFPHHQPSGRVDLVRNGNRVDVSTQGVRAFTLLLSPEEFNFSSPVTVVVNQRVAFEGRVEQDVATLLTWAARDDDRTMLFGAEKRFLVE